MEHFYQTIDGFMSHRNTVMLDMAIEQFPPSGIWVELGSWTGKSAAYCVVELVNKNKLGDFYCVDTWDGGVELEHTELIKTNSLKETFLKNIAPVLDQIIPVESLSWDAANQFENNSVDFCYVDAGHTYECVTNDLKAWWPKMRPGAMFAGDDYTKGHPGVQKAVWDFFEPLGIRVRRAGRCWLVTKPTEEQV
jgi:hypothetical protein